MNKNAYTKMMGIQKKAAGKPEIAPQGYQPLPGQGKSVTPYRSLLQFGLEQAGKPETMNEFRKLIRGFGQAGAAPGELGFWEKLWETIKSWFGSKDAEQALKRHSQVMSNRDKATAALAKFYKEKVKQPAGDAEKVLHNVNWNDLQSKAVTRDALADMNAKFYSGATPEQQKQLKEYYIGRGQQNSMSPQAPAKVNMPAFIPADKQQEIKRRGDLMAKTKAPSYKSQLMGDTAAV